MSVSAPRVLLIGFGNPARRDDGLGPELAAEVNALGYPGLTVDIDFQLSVEHAVDVSRNDIVVFADASLEGDGPFSLDPVALDDALDIGSHCVSPAAVVRLSRDLFGKQPSAFVLAIVGYEFGEIREGLSPQASENLSAARNFLVNWLDDIQSTHGQCV